MDAGRNDYDRSRLAAAAAAGVYNPGLMQLPSLADTAGRVGSSAAAGGYGGLAAAASSYARPSPLHVDLTGSAASAIGSLVQMQGWYGSHCPVLQNQGTNYSDMFGSYFGPSSSWGNLPTSPLADHFHSPIPGMTNPVWPCPPAHVSYSDGCGSHLPFQMSPGFYSPEPYITMMTGGTFNKYSPFLSPSGINASGPPGLLSPLTMSYNQQRLQDMHKGSMLFHSNNSHEIGPEYSSMLTRYMPDASPDYLGVGRHRAANGDADNASEGLSQEDSKVPVKQELLATRSQHTKDVRHSDQKNEMRTEKRSDKTKGSFASKDDHGNVICKGRHSQSQVAKHESTAINLSLRVDSASNQTNLSQIDASRNDRLTEINKSETVASNQTEERNISPQVPSQTLMEPGSKDSLEKENCHGCCVGQSNSAAGTESLTVAGDVGISTELPDEDRVNTNRRIKSEKQDTNDESKSEVNGIIELKSSENMIDCIQTTQSCVTRPSETVHGMIFEEISNDGMEFNSMPNEISKSPVTILSIPDICNVKLERSEEGCSTSHDKSVEPNEAFLNSVSNVSTNSSARGEDTKVANFFLGKMDIVKQENLYPGTGKISPPPTSNGTSPKKTKSLNEGSSTVLKVPKRSTLDLNTQQIFMQSQSMRYEVSHQRQNSTQDGSKVHKVHAPTFLPEVGTLSALVASSSLDSTMSPSGGKSGSNSTSSLKSSKQRSERLPGKPKTSRSSDATNGGKVVVKVEKQTSDDYRSREAAAVGCNVESNSKSIRSFNEAASDQKFSLSSPADFVSASQSPLTSNTSSGGFPSPNFKLFELASAELRSATPGKSNSHPVNPFLPASSAGQTSIRSDSESNYLFGRQMLDEGRGREDSGNRWARNNGQEHFQPQNLCKNPSRNNSTKDEDQNDMHLQNTNLERSRQSIKSKHGHGQQVHQLGTTAYKNQTINYSADGSSVNNIPVGIARALQRNDIPSTNSCHSESIVNYSKSSDLESQSPDVSAPFMKQQQEADLSRPSGSSVVSYDGGKKISDSRQDPHSSSPAGMDAVDRCRLWPRNGSELNPPVYPIGQNWMPRPAHTTPVNSTLWMGQYSYYHPLHLMANSLELPKPRHMFLPGDGHKVARNTLTGQYFLVPNVSWEASSLSCSQNHDSRFLDPSSLRTTKNSDPLNDGVRMVENISPPLAPPTNYVKNEDYVVENRVADDGLQGIESIPMDLCGKNPQHKDNEKLNSNSGVSSFDVGPVDRYPVVLPRSAYFCCKPHFIPIIDIEPTCDPMSKRQVEKGHVKVESRGTSPIQRTMDDCNQAATTESSFGGKINNVDGDCNKNANACDVPETTRRKAETAEISIQTCDANEMESICQASNACGRSSNRDLTVPGSTDSCTISPNSKDMDEMSCGEKTNVMIEKKVTDELAEVIDDTPNVTGETISNSSACVEIKGEGIVGNDTLSNTAKDCESGAEDRKNEDKDVTTESREGDASVKTADPVSDLEGLMMLCSVAASVNHTSLSDSDLPKKSSKDSIVPARRKFSILDIPISEFLEKEELSPDVSSSYNAPRSCFFKSEDFILPPLDFVKSQSTDGASSDFLSSITFKEEEGLETMDPMELELRMRMAEVQVKYRLEQKELARLQRLSNDSIKMHKGKRSKSSSSKSSSTVRRSSKVASMSSDSDSEDGKNSHKKSSSVRKNERFDRAFSSPDRNVVKLAHRAMKSPSKVDGRDVSLLAHLERKMADSKLQSPSSKKILNRSSSFQTPDSKTDKKYPHDPVAHDSDTTANIPNTSELQPDGTDVSTKESKKCKKSSQQLTTDSVRHQTMTKRKLGQPKKFDFLTENTLKKKSKQFCFYLYKKNKLMTGGHNHNSRSEQRKSKFVSNNKNAKLRSKSERKDKEGSKGFGEEWYRRRSERIFLHEASVAPLSPSKSLKPVHAISFDSMSNISSPSRESNEVGGKKFLADLEQHHLTHGSLLPAQSPGCQSAANFGSSSSGSEDTDDAPLSSLIQKEQNEGLGTSSCVLSKDDLVDGLRVLYLKDGLFMEGVVQEISPPDVYGVVIDCERSRRPTILSQEELLNKAVLVVRPSSLRQLRDGARVCAYWSQKFSCLYPGTVQDTSIENEQVNVEFDDGDSGKIPLDFVRMLPNDFPLQDIDTSPIMMANRRSRNSFDDVHFTDSTEKLTSASVINSRTMSVDQASISLDNNGAIETKPKLLIKKSSSCKSDESRTITRTIPSWKGEEAKLEYSCQLKKDASKNKNNQSQVRQTKEAKETSGENQDSKDKVKDAPVVEQKKSGLTLTIKRKPSFLKESSSSDDDDSSSVESFKVKKGFHPSRCNDTHDVKKKSRRDSRARSRSDSEEMEREGNKKRKRMSSTAKSSSRSRKRRRSSSSDSSSEQIGAFLPHWEQWKWSGPSTKRPGAKGQSRKEFYKAIQREREILRIGDAAAFVSNGKKPNKFIGRIDSLWETSDGNMWVKVKWYYHPEETKLTTRLTEEKHALLESDHQDINDVQTILHKCEVVSYREFKHHRANKTHSSKYLNVYYLAGSFQPVLREIRYEHGVPLLPE